MFREIKSNNESDVIQKAAWRLVRSAEDRFVAADGSAKRAWCVDRMMALFPKKDRDNLEDYIRAAFINFSIETGKSIIR